MRLLLLFVLFSIVYGQLNNNNNNDSDPINVAITFTKARNNPNLISKMQLCLNSLLKYATIDINFYIIGDNDSQKIASSIFSKIKNIKIKYKVCKFLYFSL
jgi:hypothetical protein